jgi:hypothetical protein
VSRPSLLKIASPWYRRTVACRTGFREPHRSENCTCTEPYLSFIHFPGANLECVQTVQKQCMILLQILPHSKLHKGALSSSSFSSYSLHHHAHCFANLSRHRYQRYKTLQATSLHLPPRLLLLSRQPIFSFVDASPV